MNALTLIFKKILHVFFVLSIKADIRFEMQTIIWRVAEQTRVYLWSGCSNIQIRMHFGLIWSTVVIHQASVECVYCWAVSTLLVDLQVFVAIIQHLSFESILHWCAFGLRSEHWHGVDGSQLGFSHVDIAILLPFSLTSPIKQNFYLVWVLFSPCASGQCLTGKVFTYIIVVLQNESCCPPWLLFMLLHWFYSIPRVCCQKISTGLMPIKYSVYSEAPPKTFPHL